MFCLSQLQCGLRDMNLFRNGLVREAEIRSSELGNFPFYWHWVKAQHAVPRCASCQTAALQQIAGLRSSLMGESILILDSVTAVRVAGIYQALHFSVDPVSFNPSFGSCIILSHWEECVNFGIFGLKPLSWECQCPSPCCLSQLPVRLGSLVSLLALRETLKFSPSTLT